MVRIERFVILRGAQKELTVNDVAGDLGVHAGQSHCDGYQVMISRLEHERLLQGQLSTNVAP